jgi:hypothetical protein
MADLNTLRALCAKMQEIQMQKDSIEEELSRINGELDELRLKKIPEMMAEIEVKNATFPGIGRVQLAADLYCSTRAGRKDEAMQWLRDQELDNMITMGFNASSMKALIRKMIEQGVEPPEFLNVTPFIRASIVKA